MVLEVECKELGHPECPWKAVSKTEDKLVDYVALHMREHGVSVLTDEMISDVKNIAKQVPHVHDEPEMKTFSCPHCSWKFIAQTEDLIVDAAALHARDEHNVKEFTQYMIADTKKAIRPWTGN